MSLFTSSSELKVLAVTVAVLGSVELGMRAVEDRLSIDVKHIRAIPSITAGLGKQPAPRVVFLGNSLTRASIQTKAIEQAWPSGGVPVPRMARVHPDDTTLLDWYYVYRRYLHDPKPRPNLIVVPFALSQMDDNQELHVDRLGSHFAGWRFAREAFEHDVLTTGDRVEFLLAGTFRAMAYRERVQSRVLAAIPGYKQLASAVNRSVKPKKGREPGLPKFTRLRRFLDAARANRDKVLFVAIPLPGKYRLREEMLAEIQAGGAALIDMQGVEPFERADYPDGYHLSETAAARLSRALASRMAADEFVRSALAQ